MFGLKSKQFRDEVLNHWIASADDFTLPPQEFYQSVEAHISAIKIPGLEVGREEYEEGGPLSANRIYLRLIRERLAFDICAAPFGTRYYFSCRTVYSPARVALWHVLVVGLCFGCVYYGLQELLGVGFAVIAEVALVVAILSMFRRAVGTGLADVDATLLKIPVVGPIYERFFRKNTYFRQDTRLMYLDTVPNLVRMLAEDITGGKGIKLIRQYQVAPLLGELYKPLPVPEPDKEKKNT